MQKHNKLTHLAQPFKCTQTKCVESFATSELLEAHKNEAHAKSPCPLCGKQVMTTFMEQHFERMHNKEKHVICEQCGKIFPNRYNLKGHLQSEHDNTERLQCDICKGTFRNKYNLQKHMRIIHIDKPMACAICGKISPNSKAHRVSTSLMRIYFRMRSRILKDKKKQFFFSYFRVIWWYTSNQTKNALCVVSGSSIRQNYE